MARTDAQVTIIQQIQRSIGIAAAVDVEDGRVRVVTSTMAAYMIDRNGYAKED